VIALSRANALAALLPPFRNGGGATMLFSHTHRIAMNHDSYDDSTIRGILNTVKTIAMVGASEKENRPSYFALSTCSNAVTR
jgi:hypothetical protein